MRVLLATPLYPPDPGGPATYAKLLEEGFPKLGVGVTLVKFGDVRHLPKLVKNIAYFFRIVRAGKRADVILVLDPVSTGLPAALAAFVLRKPLVLKVVGDYAWEQGRQRFGVTATLDEFVRLRKLPFNVRVLQGIETWVARRARVVIVPSEYLKGVVSAWGIAPEKIVVVYNAVSRADGGKVPEAVSALPRLRMVMVARLVPWKHIDNVIEAVATVDASLIVVGEGPEEERLKALASEKLTHYVFTGLLTPQGTQAVMRESDILVLNSSYEGMSHVLIEGLMAGIPIVATDAGGNREVLEDTGLLVPVGDTDALRKALACLAEDEGLRKELGTKARERAEAFSVPAMLARTKEVLESVV